jgi:hypothetical protein
MKDSIMFSFFLLGMTLVHSCHATKNIQQIEGKYYTSEKDYSIQINSDSTFTYSTGYSKCSGIWSLNSTKNAIKLVCQKEFELEELTNTYMKKRIHEFKIRNNQLKQGRIKLNKK